MLKRIIPFLLLTILLLLFTGITAFTQEICNNGVDDDGDGLIDLHDPDCSCHFQVTGNLLQNASFESFKNCPTNYSYTNDFNIVDYWQYGTYTNINVANYYHNFSCTYDSSLVMLYIPPSLPLPDGNSFISIRQNVYRKPQMQETDVAKAYVGQCLQASLLPGKQYTISFSTGRFMSNDDPTFRFKNTPFTVGIFGHANCNAAPFGQPYANSNGCPSNYPGWVLLGKTTVYSKGRWVQSKINFTVPDTINLIEIGPDCSLLNPNKDLPDSTTLLDFYVYYLDDLHLLPTKNFQFQYINSNSGNLCIQNSILTVPATPNNSYQWYKDSIAIQGATQNYFDLPVNNKYGNYNVRISNNAACVISEPFAIESDALAGINLPVDTSFCEMDTLLLVPPINGITYNVNGQNASVVKINREGTYKIIMNDSKGCSKTFNVMVHADNCLNTNLFIPNSFTPNGDGRNDVFKIPLAAKIKVRSFSIFDRWGNNLYNSNAASAEWNGNYKQKPCSEGTYVYIITGIVNNKQKRIKGTVYLIR